MWNIKFIVIQAATGDTEMLTKVLKKCVEAIPGKRSIESLQKTAVLYTPHIIRKVLQCET